ncbi:fibronectin type III domain-containing protein [candidate division WOR-3 bacterium]|nr:fibronectin type III domain-containing protein [candidate division WOR-3 bacterium]
MPPQKPAAVDVPNDEGGQIRVIWTWAEDPPPALDSIRLYRSVSSDSGFVVVATEPAGSTEYQDSGLQDGTGYYYLVTAYAGDDSARSPVAGPGRSRAQWFNTARTNILVAMLAICLVFFIYIARARRGARMFIRKIAGLDAIDDALGRATEMGKPILFSFGLGYITDMVVIAALPLLRRIARRSADYSTRLLVPNSDPIVMTAAQETVREAYTEAGRPDLYNTDNVNFLTSDQFGYAAGVDGILLRDRPGAVFWIGSFFAESLIMAETGHSVGAIQLAGTADTAQLPFFVAACDYTMIGEEVFAASCYLRPEPVMLGTIKGEDFIRLWLVVLAAAVVLLGTAATATGSPLLNAAFQTVVRWATPAY